MFEICEVLSKTQIVKLMDQFSTSANQIQIVQKKKSNVSPTRNLYHPTTSSFNRKILKKTGIIILQMGFLIVMLTVFNLMARNSSAQLNQAHVMVENEFLYENAFKIGFSILIFGGAVLLLGMKKLKLSLLNKENSLILKKFNDLNFKKVFGSWKIADLFGQQS